MDSINIDTPWSSGAGILFAKFHAHYVMIEFMSMSIKYHPNISSEMVKFVCYSVPSTNTSEFPTRVSSVKSLQRYDQRNLSKQESRLKKLKFFKTEAYESIKKFKERDVK